MSYFQSALLIFISLLATRFSAAKENDGLSLSWDKDYLTIDGDFPGEKVRIHYLEAYCRDGSTDRDWHETVIKHSATKDEQRSNTKQIVLNDVLQDGVRVNHVIVARADEVDFTVTAHNPTESPSRAHWAQPCVRLDAFTGAGKDGARDRIPDYVKQCFLFIDGKQTFLPTHPWADKARYVYGQVYVPSSVERSDVNPRPLSDLVPSSGLCGCISSDQKKVFAMAWEPYQEIFQGVITCLHNDFRIGGLQPNETKLIRGKIYITDNDIDALVTRYQADLQGLSRP